MRGALWQRMKLVACAERQARFLSESSVPNFDIHIWHLCDGHLCKHSSLLIHIRGKTWALCVLSSARSAPRWGHAKVHIIQALDITLLSSRHRNTSAGDHHRIQDASHSVHFITSGRLSASASAAAQQISRTIQGACTKLGARVRWSRCERNTRVAGALRRLGLGEDADVLVARAPHVALVPAHVPLQPLKLPQVKAMLLVLVLLRTGD